MKFLYNDTIELEEFSRKHISDKYLGWLNDHEVTRFMMTGTTSVTSDDIELPYGNDDMRFAISVPRVGQVSCSDYVGTISLHNICWVSRKAEIGYMIGSKQHWGRGIASQAIELVTHYAFNRLNLNKVYAEIVDGNIGSARSLEKNGFTEYARVPQDYYLDGEMLDSILFYKLQSHQK